MDGFGRKSLADLKKRLRQLGYELPRRRRRSGQDKHSTSSILRSLNLKGKRICVCLNSLKFRNFIVNLLFSATYRTHYNISHPKRRAEERS